MRKGEAGVVCCTKSVKHYLVIHFAGFPSLFMMLHNSMSKHGRIDQIRLNASLRFGIRAVLVGSKADGIKWEILSTDGNKY